MNICIKDVVCKYREKEVIHSINGIIPSGINALIGPNGSGKTTLLKCIAGIIPYTGDIQFKDNDHNIIPKINKENTISYLPQYINPHVALTAYEVILLGRMNSLKWKVGKKDQELVNNIMNEMRLSSLSESYISELSGGQRQMVFFAQAMVKSPQILLLDEPTSSLDLQYQLDLFMRIKKFVKNNGVSVIVSLHDINLACRYADNITVLKNGNIIQSGTPKKTITDILISQVYQVKADIFTDSQNNHQIVPLEVVDKED